LFAWLTWLSGECIVNALRREERTEVPNLLLYNVSKRNMIVDREQKKDLKIVELAPNIGRSVPANISKAIHSQDDLS
jgi:hypothetical protein